MKKSISIISLALISAIQANAQKTSYSAEVGLSYNTISHKINGEHRNTGYQFGYNIGGMADFQFNDRFAVNTGLFLNMNNGGTSEGSGNAYTGSNIPTSYSDTRTYKFHYLSIPALFVYKTDNSYNQSHFFFGLGGSVNFAIAGKYEQIYTETIHGRSSIQNTSSSMPYGKNVRFDRARGFDISTSAMIGYHSSRAWYFKAQYNQGLFNLAPNADGNNNIRNSGVSLSVGLKLFTAKRYAWS
jgi:hypothetical protein